MQAEDVLMLPTLLAGTRGKPGTFVELGAFDGVKFSNTLMLEKCFGWQGLLIEEHPHRSQALFRRVRRGHAATDRAHHAGRWHHGGRHHAPEQG